MENGGAAGVSRPQRRSPARRSGRLQSRHDGDSALATSSQAAEAGDEDEMSLEEVSYQLLQKKVEGIRNGLMEQIDFKLQQLTAECAPLLATATRSENTLRRKARPDISGKVFKTRESALTTLFKQQEFATIYNIFLVVLIVMSLTTIVEDQTVKFDLIHFSFHRFEVALATWALMFTQTLSLHPAIRFWATSVPATRHDAPLFLAAYLAYFGFLFVWPCVACFREPVNPATALTLGCEQLRFLMKTHAYVRETVPNILKRRRDGHITEMDMQLVLPEFGHYVYFLFAPTLVYRSSYPRTPSIRWGVVFYHLFEVFLCLFYTYYIFLRGCAPLFKEVGHLQEIKISGLVKKICLAMMPGALCLCLGFFAILHCWMNAWAELLQFGDRQFYRDWWNCRSWAMYYRTWNVVVHDWLYTYVYNDLIRYGSGGISKKTSMLITFLFSAVVHEYALFVGMGYLFPVLFVMFGGVGVFFIFLTKGSKSQAWNLFMWLMLFFGTGTLMVLYSLEFYARYERFKPAAVSELDRTPYHAFEPWTLRPLSLDLKWKFA